MNSRFSRTATQMFLLVSASALLLACSSDFAAAVRSVTYPPDFVYVSGDQLRTRMGNLGSRLAQLDNALVENEMRQPDQQEVLAILRDIEEIGSRLQASEAGASHPFLEDEMPRFVNDIARARMAASLDPPQYYLAGRVAGSCVNCHSVNR